jgi:hypothetical protein
VYRQGVPQRSISYWYLIAPLTLLSGDLLLVPACQRLSSASQSDA